MVSNPTEVLENFNSLISQESFASFSLFRESLLSKIKNRIIFKSHLELRMLTLCPCFYLQVSEFAERAHVAWRLAC